MEDLLEMIEDDAAAMRGSKADDEGYGEGVPEDAPLEVLDATMVKPPRGHERLWDAREDEVLLALCESQRRTERYALRGVYDWSEIEEGMRAMGVFRTKNDARNRLRRIEKAKSDPGKNYCLQCGALRKGHTCRPPENVAELSRHELRERARVQRAEKALAAPSPPAGVRKSRGAVRKPRTPSPRQRKWTREEYDRVDELVGKVGFAWSAMLDAFPGRTSSAIRSAFWRSRGADDRPFGDVKARAIALETAAASLEAAAADGSAAAVPPMTMFELPYESYPVETKVWTKEDFVELGYDASEIEVQPVYVESFLDEYPEGELV